MNLFLIVFRSLLLFLVYFHEKIVSQLLIKYNLKEPQRKIQLYLDNSDLTLKSSNDNETISNIFKLYFDNKHNLSNSFERGLSIKEFKKFEKILKSEVPSYSNLNTADNFYRSDNFYGTISDSRNSDNFDIQVNNHAQDSNRINKTSNKEKLFGTKDNHILETLLGSVIPEKVSQLIDEVLQNNIKSNKVNNNYNRRDVNLPLSLRDDITQKLVNIIHCINQTPRKEKLLGTTDIHMLETLLGSDLLKNVYELLEVALHNNITSNKVSTNGKPVNIISFINQISGKEKLLDITDNHNLETLFGSVILEKISQLIDKSFQNNITSNKVNYNRRDVNLASSFADDIIEKLVNIIHCINPIPGKGKLLGTIDNHILENLLGSDLLNNARELIDTTLQNSIRGNNVNNCNRRDIKFASSFANDINRNTLTKNKFLSALKPDNILKIEDPKIIKSLKRMDSSLLSFPPAFDYKNSLLKTHVKKEKEEQLKLKKSEQQNRSFTNENEFTRKKRFLKNVSDSDLNSILSNLVSYLTDNLDSIVTVDKTNNQSVSSNIGHSLLELFSSGDHDSLFPNYEGPFNTSHNNITLQKCNSKIINLYPGIIKDLTENLDAVTLVFPDQRDKLINKINETDGQIDGNQVIVKLNGFLKNPVQKLISKIHNDNSNNNVFSSSRNNKKNIDATAKKTEIIKKLNDFFNLTSQKLNSSNQEENNNKINNSNPLNNTDNTFILLNKIFSNLNSKQNKNNDNRNLFESYSKQQINEMTTDEPLIIKFTVKYSDINKTTNNFNFPINSYNTLSTNIDKYFPYKDIKNIFSINNDETMTTKGSIKVIGFIFDFNNTNQPPLENKCPTTPSFIMNNENNCDQQNKKSDKLYNNKNDFTIKFETNKLNLTTNSYLVERLIGLPNDNNSTNNELDFLKSIFQVLQLLINTENQKMKVNKQLQSNETVIRKTS